MESRIIVLEHLRQVICDWRMKSHKPRVVPLIISAKTENDEPLFRFEYLYGPQQRHIMKPATGELAEDVLRSLDRVGISHVKIEFLPPHGGESIPISPYFQDSRWLHSLQGAVVGRDLSTIFMFLDTSFICNHYGSNRIVRIQQNGLQPRVPFQVELLIPSLVSLEVELLLNKAKGKRRNEKLLREIYRKYSDLYELRFLTRNGAKVLPTLDKDTELEFSKIAGNQYADNAIRKEVTDYARGRHLPQNSYFFLTCDIVSGLSGSAVDLPTLLFTRGQNVTYGFDFDDIADLIVDLAITFGNIKVERTLETETYEFRCEGYWEGKGTDDWECNGVRVTHAGDIFPA